MPNLLVAAAPQTGLAGEHQSPLVQYADRTASVFDNQYSPESTRAAFADALKEMLANGTWSKADREYAKQILLRTEILAFQTAYAGIDPSIRKLCEKQDLVKILVFESNIRKVMRYGVPESAGRIRIQYNIREEFEKAFELLPNDVKTGLTEWYTQFSRRLINK